MQIPELPMASHPLRLRCGTCRNWDSASIRALLDGEMVGQCARFSEARVVGARPRCNICWEPAASSLHTVNVPDRV